MWRPLLLAILGSTLLAAKPVETPARVEASLRELIEQLGDVDPAVREGSAERLRKRGVEARPALLQAANSPNPEVARRAGAILLDLPWHLPGDPSEVRKLLHNYGAGDVPTRIGVVAKLNDLPRSQAAPAMLRLLQEDPSPEVAWTIVSLLRQNPDLFTQKLIRQIDTTHARVPVLVVVGRAEFNTNHKRAMDLLYRAVETGTAASENDEGELGIAINILAGRATRSGRIDEALRLRRLAARRAAVMPTGHPVGAALEVLALHADYGPAPDLSTDLARFNRHRNQSEYRYGLGRIFANQRMGLASAACYLAAHAGSRHSMEVRARIGDRLSAVGWNDLAKVEYRAVINGPREDPPLHQINAHLRMAALMSSNDHAIAAGHIQAALDLVVAIPDALVRNLPGGRMAAFDAEELVDRILYHRFMAERAAGRDASAQVAELLQRRSLDTDTVLELVEYFTQRQDHPRAHQVLDGARDRVRAELEAHPSHPGLLNELAWLSARSGLHVQEGYDLALKAVALEPDNAAFIDTLAEAAFRLGKVQMAIELEERALELRPGDAFMIEQLERFRAAAERPQINADERG